MPKTENFWDWLTGYYEKPEKPTLLTTPEQETAASALGELAYGQLPTLPTFDVGNLEAYGMGMEEIKRVLGETYDPFTSPFYQGLREASLREEEAGVSELRRRSQLGGMLKSDPSKRTEAEYRGRMGTGRTTMLGEMYETERGRKMSMIPQLLSYAGLAGDIGKFNTQIGIQQALLPYTAQAPILQGLAEGYGTWWEGEDVWHPGVLDWVLNLGSSLLKLKK